MNCRILVLPALLLATPSAYCAAGAEGAAQSATPAATSGVVTGRVLNAATQNYLSNVSVRHVASGAVTYTDTEGYFSLNVPTGEQSLSISYTGLDTLSKNISVQSGQNALGDISLTRGDYEEVIMLGEFVVATEREGRAASITQQRVAENIVNVVSSDEFPNVTSGNIGDFLQNLPGIAVDFSGADPRSVRVRGMDPNMGAVTMDGMRAANAASSSTNRVFEIDQISLQNIEAIEVTKSPTAAQEADQGGGNINLVSKSAFKTKGRRISYGLQLNANSQILTLDKSYYKDIATNHMIRPGGNFSYSESFKDRLGVSVNFSTYDYFVLNQSTQLNYNPATNFTNPGLRKLEDPNGVYVAEYVNSISPVLTSRQSLGVNLDFRLTDSTTLWLKSQVNQSYLAAGGRGLSMNAPNPRLVPAATNETLNFSDTHQESIGDAPATYNPATSTSAVHARLFTGEVLKKPGTGTTFSLGADQRFGLWTFNYAGSISQSSNHYDLKNNVGGVNFYLRGLGFNLDGMPGSPYTAITQTNGPSIWDLSSYVSRNQTTINQTLGANEPKGTFTILKQRDAAGRDKFYTAKADARRSFENSFLKYIKTGVNFRQQERSATKVGRQRWGYVGPDGTAYTPDDTAIDYGMFQATDVPQNFINMQAPPIVDLTKVEAYFQSHRNEFREDIGYRIQEELNARQSVTEKVYAGYAMTSTSFGGFNLLSGIRYERTEDEGTGVVTLPENSAITDYEARQRARYRPVTADSAYDNWFPNFQGRYTLWNDLIFRASFTKSIGRQNFGNIIPGYSIVNPSGSNPGRVDSTNIALKPVLFTNYEASVEYYLKPVGLISAGVFFKDLSNYTRNVDTTISADNPDIPDYIRDPQYIGYLWRRRVNVGEAKVRGYELNFSQQLDSYAKVLSGFSLFANYTRLQSEGNSTFGGTATVSNEKAPLEGFVPITTNAGVTYTKKKLRLSVKYNYKSQYLNNLGDIRWWNSRGVVDVYGSYDFYKKHSFFIDIKNVGNKPNSQWEGRETRIRQFDIVGAIINVGIKGSF